jgi:hypothetical protein
MLVLRVPPEQRSQAPRVPKSVGECARNRWCVAYLPNTRNDRPDARECKSHNRADPQKSGNQAEDDQRNGKILAGLINNGMRDFRHDARQLLHRATEDLKGGRRKSPPGGPKRTLTLRLVACRSQTVSHLQIIQRRLCSAERLQLPRQNHQAPGQIILRRSVRSLRG